MKTNTADKLLIGLTGKEVYQAAMMYWIDRVQQNPLRFSEADVKKAIDALASRSNELNEYNRWCKASDSIEITQAEMRVEAMYAVWKLEILYWLLLFGCPPIIMENNPEILQNLHKEIKGRIESVELFHMILEAYGKVLGCDVPAFAQCEYDVLKKMLHCSNFVLEKCGHINLSPLKLDPGKLPPDTMQQFISAIERGDDALEVEIMRVVADIRAANQPQDNTQTDLR